MTDKPFEPTRAHPHPQCHRLHALIILFGILCALPLIVTDLLLGILCFGFGVALAHILPRMIFNRSMHEVIEEEDLPAASVSTAWTRAAVSVDIILCVTLGLAAFLPVAFAIGLTTWGESNASAADLVGVLAWTAFILGADQYTHYRAVHPNHDRQVYEEENA